MSKKAKARIVFFAVASVAMALIISLIVGLVFFVSLHKTDSPEEINRYKVILSNSAGRKKTTYLYRQNAVKDGILCVNFSQLTELCGFTIVGDGNNISFYINNPDGDILDIELGKDTAYVNKNPVHLAVPAYKTADIIYLPLDFVSLYFGGISFENDFENAVINIQYLEAEECFLKLDYPKNISPVSPDSLPN